MLSLLLSLSLYQSILLSLLGFIQHYTTNESTITERYLNLKNLLSVNIARIVALLDLPDKLLSVVFKLFLLKKEMDAFIKINYYGHDLSIE